MIKVGLAQLAPVWLDRDRTIEKTLEALNKLPDSELDLIIFGESYLPGYPFWLSITDGAKFESAIQKEIYAHYLKQAVSIEKGHLAAVQEWSRKNKTAIYIGIVERPSDRGGHSLYCSLVYINKSGQICSVHRKLQPTYEERLCWSPGDGHGLKTHELNGFTVGGLNCWENWMPMTRSALYAQGENLHVAVWPGSINNTRDITQFIAKESRSYVVSVSSLLKKSEIPTEIPYYDLISASAPDILANGGSCVADPAGKWLLAPVENKEGIFAISFDTEMVYRERQNFDPSGHYSRPDVLSLNFNDKRNKILEIPGDQEH